MLLTGAAAERTEFQMTTSFTVKNFLLGASMVLGIAVHAADEPAKTNSDAPAATETKPEQHIMMDHSRANTKAMRMMKDKKVKIHTAGDPSAPDATKPGEEHIMMNHSMGDTKSMGMMKDKTIPIHKSGDCVPTPEAAAPAPKPRSGVILDPASRGRRAIVMTASSSPRRL